MAGGVFTNPAGRRARTLASLTAGTRGRVVPGTQRSCPGECPWSRLLEVTLEGGSQGNKHQTSLCSPLPVCKVFLHEWNQKKPERWRSRGHLGTKSWVGKHASKRGGRDIPAQAHFNFMSQCTHNKVQWNIRKCQGGCDRYRFYSFWKRKLTYVHVTMQFKLQYLYLFSTWRFYTGSICFN